MKTTCVACGYESERLSDFVQRVEVGWLCRPRGCRLIGLPRLAMPHPVGSAVAAKIRELGYTLEELGVYEMPLQR